MEIIDLLITKDIAEKLSRKHNVEVYEVYEVFWKRMPCGYSEARGAQAHILLLGELKQAGI